MWPKALRRVFSNALKVTGSRTVRFEQAVYGSFPFRDQGYAMLAQSPGCLPGGLAEFRAACQKLGERPQAAAEANGLFTTRDSGGARLIVGISPQGRDDRGRPGALAFHGLFLSARDYRKLGHSPFHVAGAFRRDWDATTSDLPSGVWPIRVLPAAVDGDPRAERIAGAIARGRRVIIESPRPIEDLARQVWARLPRRVRERASVATWAFGNANRFDLLAVPRLAGVAIDASYDVEVVDGPARPCLVSGPSNRLESSP